jgi:hypothetical protein
LQRAILVFVLAIAAFACGCRDGDMKAIESKCDAPLRQRAEDMARADESGPIEVLGRADGPIDEPRRLKLAKAGAEVGTVTGDLFTARIPVRKLGEVARLDFVKSLQLSQEREPLKP